MTFFFQSQNYNLLVAFGIGRKNKFFFLLFNLFLLLFSLYLLLFVGLVALFSNIHESYDTILATF